MQENWPDDITQKTMYVYISENGFLVSSELQELLLSDLQKNQCTSSFPPARIAVDAERNLTQRRRDECVGVTEDQGAMP